MKEKRNSAVSIIGGADGPTSVLILGRNAKKPLKERLRQYIYRCKRKKMEKRIIEGAHTLKEVATYASAKYGAVEISKTQKKYIEQCKNLKESLLIRLKPEMLDAHQTPMDFHVYEIRIGDGCMEIEIDYIWDIFGVSYSGSKKVMKQLKKIAQDLYIYYGVTKEDIRNKSERYSSLLTTLSI